MFADKETSRQQGQPVELYQFIYGPSGESYTYTNAEKAITLGSLTYVPMPMDRDGIKSSGSLDKTNLTVSTSLDSEVAELFRVYPPARQVTLIIRSGHVNDPDQDFKVVWSGRVLSCKRADSSEAQFTCEPVQTAMQRPGLRRHYQYGCPHALYMAQVGEVGCHANKAAATSSATVSDINGATITLAPGWNGSTDRAKYLGGMIEFPATDGGVEIRTIIGQGGDTLQLSGLVRNIEAGDTISVIKGCNHQMDDCANIHHVIQDFGGQWLIPTKSPLGTTNNYY